MSRTRRRRHEKLGILFSNELFKQRSVPLKCLDSRHARLLEQQLCTEASERHVCERCQQRFSDQGNRPECRLIVLVDDDDDNNNHGGGGGFERQQQRRRRLPLLVAHRHTSKEFRQFFNNGNFVPLAGLFCYAYESEWSAVRDYPDWILSGPAVSLSPGESEPLRRFLCCCLFDDNDDDIEEEGGDNNNELLLDYDDIVTGAHRLRKTYANTHEWDREDTARVIADKVVREMTTVSNRVPTSTSYYDWDAQTCDEAQRALVPVRARIRVMPLFRSSNVCTGKCARSH